MRPSPQVCWLAPEQTAGKKKPFVYTQGQAVLNRAFFPCFDTPAVKCRYSALLEVRGRVSLPWGLERSSLSGHLPGDAYRTSEELLHPQKFICAKAHRLSPSLVSRSPCTSGGLQAVISTGQAADGKLALSRRNLAGFLCPQVPDGFTAVMSADAWEERGPNKFFFRMSQPIPSYLIALAIGDLVSAEVGPR